MYEYLLSIFLGIVEGLTEFLPVSSTAHLRICEALLHIDLHDGFWKMYTIVIQLGAILALPVYFRHRILQFLRTFPKGERGNCTILTHPLSLTLIAFVVTAVPAWVLTKQIGKNLENLWVMAQALPARCPLSPLGKSQVCRVRPRSNFRFSYRCRRCSWLRGLIF